MSRQVWDYRFNRLENYEEGFKKEQKELEQKIYHVVMGSLHHPVCSLGLNADIGGKWRIRTNAVV